MNKNGYTEEYYFKKIDELNSKMDPYLNDALLSTYGALLSAGTKSEFPLFFICCSILSIAQIDYYISERSDCYRKMENEEGLTEPIKLRKIIEYKQK